MQTKWIVMWIVLAVILIVTVAPLVSALTAGWIASANGCALDEGSVHPCLVNGTDIGETLYTFGVLGWLMLATIPLGALGVLVWVIVAVIMLASGKRKAAQPPAGS